MRAATYSPVFPYPERPAGDCSLDLLTKARRVRIDRRIQEPHEGGHGKVGEVEEIVELVEHVIIPESLNDNIVGEQQSRPVSSPTTPNITLRISQLLALCMI